MADIIATKVELFEVVEACKGARFDSQDPCITCRNCQWDQIVQAPKSTSGYWPQVATIKSKTSQILEAVTRKQVRDIITKIKLQNKDVDSKIHQKKIKYG